MDLLTSSFFTFRGAGRISIARSAPRGQSGYRTYRALAPAFPGWNSLPQSVYRERYMDQLDRLDIDQVIDDLSDLAGDATPVLLCWERPPLTATNWCHRRMFAEYVETTCGLSVPEYDPKIHVLSHPAQQSLFAPPQPPDLDPDRHVSLVEACKLTGMSARSIMDLRLSGQVPHNPKGYRLGDLLNARS